MAAAGRLAWKDLGKELIPKDDAALGIIEVNNSDVTACCEALFKTWLERQPEASWGQLIEGLKKIGQGTLARQIEDKLEPSVALASSHTTTATASQIQKGTKPSYITIYCKI